MKISGNAMLVGRSGLSMGEKVSRLGGRLRDPLWRRYGMQLMLGKLLGLAVLLAVIFVVPAVLGGMFGTPALAQQAAAATAPDPYSLVKGGDIVNPLNTVWTLVGAFLVFGMQVG